MGIGRQSLNRWKNYQGHKRGTKGSEKDRHIKPPPMELGDKSINTKCKQTIVQKIMEHLQTKQAKYAGKCIFHHIR